jgi:SAM-dependent methyltransferase
MVAEARERGPGAWFAVADITAPMRLPVDIAYARLLLGHLPDPAAALARWVAAMRPPGILVCEEPARYRSDDPLFLRYESAVTAVVNAHGGSLWASPVLDCDPVGCGRFLDRVVEHPVRVGRAAAMFWRNAVTWGDDVPDAAELIDELRAVERADPDAHVVWELRQTAWSRRA